MEITDVKYFTTLLKKISLVLIFNIYYYYFEHFYRVLKGTRIY
jgi:hypothetical protein